ncbi:MAG: family 20 glycosylhydrolase [Lentisphaeria bacterium]|nr:family 20 glycosylhydrolase [Lentisphaeria bacterium]
MRNHLNWNPEKTPKELGAMLEELGHYYPVRRGSGDGLSLVFEEACDIDGCEIRVSSGIATIRHATMTDAARGVGACLSGLVSEREPYVETTSFKTMGIMLDCSRNAVMTVDHVQRWLRQLSLLGYNMVMLYTEDTYALPGEPYFGYQRGAYSAAELKAIDDYAALLGIEIVPCIQTLGHLEKILRYGAYNTIRDTGSVMLVGESSTYELIEKMVSHWKSVCRTDRIHLGMDETHDLGRGRYLDKHGYRHGFDLFNEHLARVVKICEKHGLKPIIWSDMYFRLGCESGLYYDKETVIPDAVAEKVPRPVDLVYWDYYHGDKAFYLDWIARHRQLGKEPLMGSGIWTWNRYWYDHTTTARNAGPCIEACKESRLAEIFFTMWGDNGAYCDHDSAFAGMVFCAEKAYNDKEPDADRLEKRFGAVCGGSYAAHLLASGLHGAPDMPNPNMWDDPIFETAFRTWAGDDPGRMAAAAAGYADLADRLKRYADRRETGDFRYAFATARAFADRCGLAADLLRAYRSKDRKGLQAVKRRIGGVADSVLAMEQAFRDMWMSHNKPEGIETIQGRFGMLRARYRELDRRLDEFLAGEVSCVAELDYACPPS